MHPCSYLYMGLSKLTQNRNSVQRDSNNETKPSYGCDTHTHTRQLVPPPQARLFQFYEPMINQATTTAIAIAIAQYPPNRTEPNRMEHNGDENGVNGTTIEEQEEALVALIEHRTREVKNLRHRLSYYKSQVPSFSRSLSVPKILLLLAFRYYYAMLPDLFLFCSYTLL